MHTFLSPISKHTDLTVDIERSVDIQVYITRTVKKKEKLNERYTD